MKRRLARFEKACRKAGAKLTHQRLEIFRELARSGAHPDAEEVFRGVRERVPTVSLDTVYRTLWWLEKLGLVSVLGPRRERARFDANLERHHHFVCSRCAAIHDFTCAAYDGLKVPAALRRLGKIDHVQVEVVGVCRSCAGDGDAPEER